MAKKNVPVTSVTPAIKVKASTEKEKASTRKTVGMIASAVPVGRAVKAVATAAKAVNTTKDVKKVAAAYTKTKQAVPSKIKTPTQSYDIKKTPTGKIKATNTKTGISVTLPKNEPLNILKIKQAHAQKFINKSK